MDLRVVKTKKAIRDAFLQLREKQPLEKIRVTELCKIALINKTTFYKYYQDIYALSEELEEEAFSVFWNHFHAKDCLLTDPQCFFQDISRLVSDSRKNDNLLHLLYYDRPEILMRKLEHSLKDRYIQSCKTDESDICLTFIIGGIMHTIRQFKFNGKYDDEVILQCIANCIEKLQKD